ncbi:MAG: response regulator, partial [Burkholderiaceae bacterium]|nr:response regulator [Burkholderiaceae bacterium]
EGIVLDISGMRAMQRQLASPLLVHSRRIDAGARPVDAADLSLEIPPDADTQVVDHLRRELPALSAQFSTSVDRILEGSVDALGEARRIAHTLKGSAVTVGVRGVATLTHRLEDLLQLLDESHHQPAPLLAVALAEAADCLGQMTDAVAGHGEAPDDALAVCELLGDWVRRLASPATKAVAPETAPAGERSPERRGAAGGDADSRLADARQGELEPAAADAAGADRVDVVDVGALAAAFDASALDTGALDKEAVDGATIVKAALDDAALDRAIVDTVALDTTTPVTTTPVTTTPVTTTPVTTTPVTTTPDTATPDTATFDTATFDTRTGDTATFDTATFDTRIGDTGALAQLDAAQSARSRPGGQREGAAQPEGSGDESALRVPASLVDRMLDLAGETAMVLAQVQEQMRELGQTHRGARGAAERLSQLCGELERVVDSRGATLEVRTAGREFDPLELDEFDELHTLSRRIAEVAADDKLLERQLERQLLDAGESLGRLERVQTDLREAVVRSRMIPVAAIVGRLQRAVRQAARISGKSVALELTGEDVGIDAQLLQALVDPLTHLLRNAVDHGIEDPLSRAHSGKPALGRVSLSFTRYGQNLSIRCRDDGRGLDYAAIGARATELGLREAGAGPDAGELARVILRPGFSTRRAATELSGRGIGLDVVSSAVARLRGTLQVESTAGEGVSVLVVVPERIASLPVMVVRAGAHVLALSIRGVDSIVAAQPLLDDGAEPARCLCEGEVIEVVRLDSALGLSEGSLRGDPSGTASAPGGGVPDRASEVMMIVKRDDGVRVALLAPESSQPRTVVMRPLPDWFAREAAIDGATVLGDGAVAPVIDLPALLARERGVGPQSPPEEPRDGAPRCLVVDDSVSVRRAMEAFLKDLGLGVESAADGEEALERFDRNVPDLAILDLEMPRMNGLELARAIRARSTGRRVALIMITSRGSDKHREMAFAAGVDAFMTKPYTEDELASQIRRCLEPDASLG